MTSLVVTVLCASAHTVLQEVDEISLKFEGLTTCDMRHIAAVLLLAVSSGEVGSAQLEPSNSSSHRASLIVVYPKETHVVRGGC